MHLEGQPSCSSLAEQSLSRAAAAALARKWRPKCLSAGNLVSITGRKQKALDDAKRSLSPLGTIPSDVSDRNAMRALYEIVIARFRHLAARVNNARIMRNLKFGEERSLEDVTREIDLDLNVPVWMVQQCLPHLRKQSSALILNG